MIKKIPGKVLTKINQKVGFSFVTKFGTKGIVNLGKLIPGVGAVIGGGLDLVETKIIAKRSYKWFFEHDFSVNKKGEVYVNDERIGNINLYKATGDNDFLSTGNNLFIINDGAQVIQANGDIHQGYIEMSNVNTAQEFTDLISMQRAFQLNSKGFSVADEMWSMINNLQSR